jgi:hypothetical protein
LKQSLSTAELTAENADTAWAAVMDYESHGAGFADCLLERLNQDHGCGKTSRSTPKPRNRLALNYWR